ncbi:MAG: sporulation protein YqfD [Clostridia bacterium]|nr:sporulation protein YqfD [Clostridia bacterium]
MLKKNKSSAKIKAKKNKAKNEKVKAVFSLKGERVTLKIECPNRALMLKKLVKAGINVKKAVVLDAKTTLLTISEKHIKKTFAICDNMCYTYKVWEYSGIKCCIKPLLKRAGLIVGALAISLTAIITDGYLLKIEVNGLSTVTASEVTDHLGSHGIKVGARKDRISVDKVKTALYELGKIASCAVLMRANTLIISVTETENSTARPQGKNSIVSAVYGKVSKIICRNGTPKVKVGQIVKEGQTLIEGLIYDQNGEVLAETTAVGEVYVTTTQTKSRIVTGDFYEYKSTGKTVATTAIEIFGLRLFGSTAPYENYRSTTKSAMLWGLIPVKIIQTEYAQTERVKSDKTVEQYAQELAEDAKNQAITPDLVKVIESKYHIENLAPDEYQITVALTTERKMS